MVFLRFFLMGFALINFSFASDSEEDWGDEAVVPQKTLQYPTEMSFENQRDYPVMIKFSRGNNLISEIELPANETSSHQIKNGTYEGINLTIIAKMKKQKLLSMPGVKSLIVTKNGLSFGPG